MPDDHPIRILYMEDDPGLARLVQKRLRRAGYETDVAEDGEQGVEQYQAGEAAVGENAKWIKEQDMCLVTLWNGSPIQVAAPNFVELQVTETDPGVRGDTSSGGNKPATLETGVTINVPLFVKEGDKLVINTETGQYDSRANE